MELFAYLVYYNYVLLRWQFTSKRNVRRYESIVIKTVSKRFKMYVVLVKFSNCDYEVVKLGRYSKKYETQGTSRLLNLVSASNFNKISHVSVKSFYRKD